MLMRTKTSLNFIHVNYGTQEGLVIVDKQILQIFESRQLKWSPTIEIDHEWFAPFDLEWVKSPCKTYGLKMQIFN